MEIVISDFISQNITPDMAKQYSDFCDWIHDNVECNESVTSLVFANIHFKKKLAKRIVESLLHDDICSYKTLLLRDSKDARLRALIRYYLSAEIYSNPDLREKNIHAALSPFATWDGLHIEDSSVDAIVRMQQEDPFYQGWRFFVVNMLCFTADRFVLGFKKDNEPLKAPMKYFKGCKPLGIRTSRDGTQWNAIMFDRTLSDDHIAIFSNTLDGEGSIKICDWISDDNQRIIYRCAY